MLDHTHHTGITEVEFPDPAPRPTVLLVDDDDMLRRVTSMQLKKIGFEVLEASHGTEALRMMQECGVPIDLTLTDVYMPGLRGGEFAELLHEKHPGTPVVFMSGYGASDMARSGVTLDSRFLQKPFAFAELKATVIEALKWPTFNGNADRPGLLA